MKQFVVEYGGSKENDRDPETIGYEVIDETDLPRIMNFINGSRFKMNIIKRYFKVYEFGVQVYDTTDLERFREEGMRKDRYEKYLRLKAEFDPEESTIIKATQFL